MGRHLGNDVSVTGRGTGDATTYGTRRTDGDTGPRGRKGPDPVRGSEESSRSEQEKTFLVKSDGTSLRGGWVGTGLVRCWFPTVDKD